MASTLRTRTYLRPVVAALTALIMMVGGASLATAAEPLTFTAVPTPVISGTAAVGQTLSASFDGSAVLPAHDSANLTWFVDGASVGTADSIGLGASDVGKVVFVRLTVFKAGYENGTADSASVVVAPGTQSFTPKILGAPAVGSTLSVTGLAPDATSTYQWKRNGSSISGARGATYKLTSADLGKTISVAVTAQRSGYVTLSKTSASTATIKKAFSTASSPRISGTAKAGYTLTATTSAWSPTAAFKYQWYRNGVAISGATTNTRKLSGADAGTTITVKVTGSRTGYYTLTKTSAATAIIAEGTIAVGVPKITGTTRAGSTLKVTAATPNPSTAVKTYQWFRNGVRVDGATSTNYALKNVDAGKKITVTVTYTFTGFYTKTVTSAATATIAQRVATFTNSLSYYENPTPGAIYYTNTATADCLWLRDGDTDPENGWIVEYEGQARWMVQLSTGDAVFFVADCGSWIRYDGTGSQSTTITKDGVYAIGVDVKTGVYQQSGANLECYVTYESNASGEPSAILADGEPGSGAQITIGGEGNFFTTWGCGTWTRVGDLPLTE